MRFSNEKKVYYFLRKKEKKAARGETLGARK